MQHSPGPKLEQWFKDIGFVNIKHRLVKLPWGFWPKDPALKDVGIWNLQQMLNGLEAYAMRPFCDVLGWTEQEVLVFMSSVRKELKNPNVHGYYNWYVLVEQYASELHILI